MKNIFQPARGTLLPVVLFVFIAVSLMFIDHRSRNLEPLRVGISVLISPLRQLINLPPQAGNWVLQWFRAQEALILENENLRDRERLLNARLQKMAVLSAENARLRSLLGSARKVADTVIVAELLEVDQNPYRQLILLNKGSLDDLREGQAVIDDYGIMGQIIHVTPNTATVKLISDPEHAIPVQFVRGGARSVAFGNGSTDELELRFLPATADIEPGDELVSSGLGGRFPAGYPVATIVSVRLDKTQGFKSAIARPRARLDRSREVLVIKTPVAPLPSEQPREGSAPAPGSEDETEPHKEPQS